MNRRTVAHLESIHLEGTRGLAFLVRLDPRERYLIFSVGLVLAYSALFLFYVPGKTDDYWDHTAALRAMAENLRTPAHPFFAGSYLGDRWFNPYLFSLAVLSRATGLSSFSVMKVGAIVNLLLLCTGMYLFAASYGKRRGAAVWMLVAYLFFWTTRGATMREWAYYPSFFVACGSFLFWYVLARYLRDGDKVLFGLTVVMGWVLWLSHQLQGGLAIGNGILLAFLEKGIPRDRRLMVMGVFPVLVIGLGEIWPYFSSLRLLLGNFSEFGYAEPGLTMSGQLLFYGYIHGPNLIAIALASLIGSPAGIGRFLRASILCAWPIWVMLFLLRSQYATLLFGHIGSMAALWIGLALAPQAENADSSPLYRFSGSDLLRKGLIVVLSLTILLQIKYTIGWVREFYWIERGVRYREMVREYATLAQFIGPHDVVFSDLWTSWHLPTFTGKVITRPEGHQLDYNVPRLEIRQRALDLKRFFAPETPDEVRRSLIEKYGVKFVLVNRVLSSGIDFTSFAEWGSVIFASNAFTLIAVPRHDFSTSSWPFRSQT